MAPSSAYAHRFALPAGMCATFLAIVAFAGCSDDGSTGEGPGTTIEDTATQDVAVDVGAVDQGKGDASKVDLGTGLPDGACTPFEKCDDGNPCTTEDTCIAGVCVGGKPLVCDTSKDSACSTTACVPDKNGCVAVPRPDGTVCADSDPCTVTASCQSGVCKAGKHTFCTCKSTDDCAAEDDGNPCNGTLYCDLKVFPWRCETKPGTVVTCQSGDAECSLSSCDPKTGKCVVTNKTDGTVCEDGDVCTKNDACKAGKCTPELNVCTCSTTADCKLLDDNDLCNGSLYCDKQHKDEKGKVVPKCKVNQASIVTCAKDKDTTCVKNTCKAASGKCVMTPTDGGTPCDDGDKCTKDDVCYVSKCIAGTNTCICKSDDECKSKDDGDLCNGSMFCNKVSGKCEVNPATVVTCPSALDTTCAQNVCHTAYETKGGKKVPVSAACKVTPVPDGKLIKCDDGKKCTQGDVCVGGKCKSGTEVCFCLSDKDCAGQEDGDVCNGTLFCDKTHKEADGQVKPKCKVNPKTVVKCPTANNTTCRSQICDKATGKCPFVLAADGKPCDDGAVCTTSDFCSGGSCAAGKYTCECDTHADCAGKDDGDLCNGTFFCDKSAMKTGGKPACKFNPASKVACPKGQDTDCVKNACDPKTGACFLANMATKTSCSDGDACTVSDSCADGACKAGTNVCPCQKNADCAAKDDGDVCNGVLYCDTTVAGKFKCKPSPASKVFCDKKSDTSCVKNSCDPKTGVCALQPVKNGTACDDGSKCTTSDTCKAGLCKPGTDLCECQTNADCAAKDDGDKCNGVAFCDKSVAGKHTCKANPNSVVTCPTVSDTACIKNRCDKKTGACNLNALPNKTSCNDGDGCTANDACKSGKCTGGTFTCKCKTNDDCVAQDDGNLCNGVPYCDKSKAGAYVCKPNPSSIIHCPQNINTACLANTCDGKTGKCGLQPFNEGKGCNDGDPCTAGDLCGKGVCKGPGKTNCDDKDACTADSCDVKKGCVHLRTTCNDGNSCTVDQCDPKTAKCDFSKVLKDGSTCNADGSGCTVNDVCTKGVCSAGTPVKCTLPVKQCEKAFCSSTGPASFKCLTGDEKEGTLCDDGSACTLDSACKKGVCKAGTKPKFWTDVVGDDDNAYRFEDVSAFGTGLVVAGSRQQTVVGNPIASYAVIHRVTRSGAPPPVWKYELKAGAVSSDVRFRHARAYGNNHVVAVGGSNAGKQTNGLFVRLDKTGKAVAVHQHKRWEHLDFADLAQVGDGTFVIAANAKVSGKKGGAWVHLTDYGALKGAVDYPGLDGDELFAVDISGGKDAFLAGRSGKDTAGVVKGLLLRVDRNGKQQWRKSLRAANVTDTVLRDIHTVNGPQVLAVGSHKDSNGTHAFVLRTRSDGQVIWRRATAGKTEARAMRYLPNDGLFVAGQSPNASGGHNAWAMMTDAAGNPVWQRTFTSIGGATSKDDAALRGASIFADGFAVAGYRTSKTGKKGLVTSLSSWGDLLCKDAGKCAAVSFKDCNDGQSCTVDVCSKTTGKCTYSPVDKLACDPKNGCSLTGTCKFGKCKAEDNGKLWTELFAWERKSAGKSDTRDYKHAGVKRIHGLRDGGVLVLGVIDANYQYKGVSTGYLRRLDDKGELQWTATHNGDNNAYHFNQAIFERKNGELLLAHEDGAAGHSGLNRLRWGYVRRYSASGKFISSPNWRIDFTINKQLHQFGPNVFADTAGGGLVYFVRNQYVRRDSALKQVATVKLTNGGAAPLATAVVVENKGRAIVVGRIADSTGNAWAALLGPNGSPIFNRNYAAMPASTFTAVRIDSGGDFLAAGVTNGGKRELFVARLKGANGGLLARRVVGNAGTGAAVIASRGPLDGFAWIGSLNKTNVLHVSDITGTRLYSRDLVGGTGNQIYAMASTKQGLAWGGTRIAPDGKSRSVIVSAGPWGMASCGQAQKCTGVSFDDCDDSNPCTIDTCHPKGGCVHAKDKCDDGNACTVDKCDAKTGCAHAPITCDDNIACTKNVCAAVGNTTYKPGCNYPLIAACIDGNKCTHDRCEKTGKCANPKVDCNDNNQCTVDSCDPKTGCKNSETACNDHEPCTLDTCNAKTGCKFVKWNDGVACKDNEVCSLLGAGNCSNLKCLYGGVSYKGCHSKVPATSCLAAKNAANGKLNKWVGWAWLDKDGDGLKPTRQWCDMPAGGYELLYSNGINRSTNTWAPGSPGVCGGGMGATLVLPSLHNAYNKPKPTITVNGVLETKPKHTKARVVFDLMMYAPNNFHKDYLQVQVQLAGKTVYKGNLGGLKNLYGSHPKSWGTCSKGFAWRGDYNVAHTDQNIALTVKLSSTAKTLDQYWRIARTSVWLQ